MTKENGMDEGLVLFRLGGERYAMPLACVRELARVPIITPVPRTPSYVAGVANLRGNVLGIIDLGAVVGVPPSDSDPRKRRMMVVHVDGVTAGILVDVVEGVADIEGEIDPPVPTLPDALRPYVRGHLRGIDARFTICVLEPTVVVALRDRVAAEV